MDGPRFDAIARSFASSRRGLMRGVLGLGLGGLVALRRPPGTAANHKDGHCAKVGQRCRRHKDCCGTCGPDGVCLSCAGVVAWADLATHALGQSRAQATTATAAAAAITAYFEETGEVDDGSIATIEFAAAAIDARADDFATAATPDAASDPLRTLLELLAEMADALSAYLDQIADEAFIETAGDALETAIVTALADAPALEAEIAALRDDCAP